MEQIALEYNDGTIGIMQMVGEATDARVQAAVKKQPRPVVKWSRITDAEANEIRAKRPKPQPKPEALGGPVTVAGPDHSETIAELTNVVAALASELNAMKHRVERTEIIADAIERGVEESAKNG